MRCRPAKEGRQPHPVTARPLRTSRVRVRRYGSEGTAFRRSHAEALRTRRRGSRVFITSNRRKKTVAAINFVITVVVVAV
ncbi:hypothetical protein E2C01_038614 [Portunus trituberculatus]|uniref:Uncharacterized protein n=1 Tax=Portunus trituberculatus TaxID=210409 RepID=A0A5B7FEL1_PORTR|nr:hypothetical protein [Portunus trituberculatus]